MFDQAPNYILRYFSYALKDNLKFVTFRDGKFVKKKWMTAAEHTKMLEQDPLYLEMRRKQALERQRKEEMLAADVAPLARDLMAVGINIQSSWDLVAEAIPYTQAIPILLKHLHYPYHDRNLEGIARSLAVPDAGAYWSELKELYIQADPESGVKDGLAVALSVAADDTVFNELVLLLKDPSHGRSRMLLTGALKKSRHPQLKQVIADLAQDDLFAKEIASWGRRWSPARK